MSGKHKNLKRIINAYETAKGYAGLAASTLTPFVPSDLQEKIYEKTGVSSRAQTTISALSEAAAFGGFFHYYGDTPFKDIMPTLPVDMLMAAFLFTASLPFDAFLRFGAQYSDQKNTGFAYIPLEIAYQIAKIPYGVYQSFENAYSDAKREISEERSKRVK